MSIREYFENKKREAEKAKKREIVKKFGLGAVVGTMIGSVTGILFAPKSGKETRKDISDTAIKTGKHLKQKGNELKEVVSKKYDEAINKIQEYREGNLTDLHSVVETVEEEIQESQE